MAGAGSLFGGFAKAIGGRLIESQQREAEEERKNREFELNFAIEQANRPDLRPELRPKLIGKIMELAGNRGKPRPEFQAGLDTILSMISGPNEAAGVNRVQAGALPSAARMTGGAIPAVQRTGIPGQEGIPYAPNETFGEAIVLPPKPGEANLMDTPIMRAIPKSPFLSPDEIQAQQLKGLEGQLQLQQKYKPAPETKVLSPQVFTDEEGRNRMLIYDQVTGETKTIDAPPGATQGVVTQQMRNKGIGNRTMNQAERATRARAYQMAAADPANDNTQITDEIVQRYMGEAGRALEKEAGLNREVKKSTIGRNTASSRSLTANLPKKGEPTASAQRGYTQKSKEIDEIQDEINNITKKGGTSKIYGKTLADGTKIEAPKGGSDAEFERIQKQKTQYLRELEERKKALMAERQQTSMQIGPPQRDEYGDLMPPIRQQNTEPSVGPAMPTGSEPLPVPTRMKEPSYAKLADINPETGKPWGPGDIFTIKGTRYMIQGPRASNGRFPVEVLTSGEIKPKPGRF